MGSKSENFEILPENIEARNEIFQDLFGLARSIDSNCAIRMIIERWGEEISTERSNGWSEASHFGLYREDCRSTLSIKRDSSLTYIYRIGKLKVDHDCRGQARGYGREMRTRSASQFWEIENLSLRGRRSFAWAVQSLQKWIEWLWPTRMISDILLSNQWFQFRDVLCVLSHSLESASRQFTPSWRIIFQTRYFSLSSLPQSSLPVGKFPFFEQDS
jgi:hypothetical protein